MGGKKLAVNKLDTRSIHGLNGTHLGYFLERNSVLFANRVAIIDIDQEKRLTYAELNRRVNQLANSLQMLGISSGDHVAFLMNDKAECLELLFALNRIGAVWVPVNCRFTEKEVLAQIQHSDATALVFDNEFETIITNIQPQLSLDPNHYISIGETQGTYTDYEQLVAQGLPDQPNVHVEGSAPCGIIYTSGTTGIPKGAVHSHETMIGWAMNPILVAGWRWEDRVLNPYPMFHLGGTVVSIALLLTGATNVIFGKFDVKKFLQTVERERVTSLAVVPTILNSILKLPEEEIKQYNWSSLRSLATSSAPLMSDAQELIMKYWPNVQLFTLYSATELFFTTLLPDDHERKTRCVGFPSYGMEVKVINEDGEAAKPGEVGLIYGRGVSLFKGYYKNPEAEKSSFKDGWFTCDDMGYFDEDGYLYVVDRKKDMINSGGEKISSIEVEDLLLTHPDVKETAVVGVPDDVWGERVHAVVSLKPGRQVSEEDILNWCKDRIAGYKRPRSIEIMEEIPKTPVGKISKKDLRTRAISRL
jgi:long-chain acyl-CoA synthetase